MDVLDNDEFVNLCCVCHNRVTVGYTVRGRGHLMHKECEEIYDLAHAIVGFSNWFGANRRKGTGLFGLVIILWEIMKFVFEVFVI